MYTLFEKINNCIGKSNSNSIFTILYYYRHHHPLSFSSLSQYEIYLKIISVLLQLEKFEDLHNIRLFNVHFSLPFYF